MSSWSTLHAGLCARISTRSFLQTWRGCVKGDPVLAKLGTPERVFGLLHGADAAPEQRNTVLAALVRLSQTPGGGDVAQPVLLLALWPALDAIRGRLRRHFDHPDELSAEIASRAAEQIGKLDLGRVNRIAATVQRNVKRDIVRALKREWATRAVSEVLDEDDPIGAPADPQRSVRNLTELLHDHVGEDAMLVTDVAILGYSLREVSENAGLSYEAGRKRYQRALARLRTVPELS